jgi:D-alanyl-lipoteichoic acid acyltransferase DltB (MBOAT superfamily)
MHTYIHTYIPEGTDDKGNAKWHGVTNCYALSCEMATSMPALTNNWNLGINRWLKHYVYLRIPNVFQSRAHNNSLKNMVTKSLAAFWHGFYPGYEQYNTIQFNSIISPFNYFSIQFLFHSI